MTGFRILCDTNPMCYGSSTAALSILDHVDAHVTALTRGVTSEVLCRDKSVHETIDVDVKNADEVRACLKGRTFDAVLVVSNQSNVGVYRELGLPIIFVDVLYWFGGSKTQPVWSVADRTFVQRFPGVPEKVAGLVTGAQPTMVGPLVRPLPHPRAPASGTLVQIGGATSSFVRPGINSPFPTMVMDWIERLSEHVPQPITLASGHDALAVAARHRFAANVRLQSFPLSGFLQELVESQLYITTPGQGAVFDGLRSSVPMAFLPAQNVTQVAQHRVYEAHSLVAPGLGLGQLDAEYAGVEMRTAESQSTQRVLESLGRLNSRSSAEHIAAHVREQLREFDRRSGPRKQFLTSLGAPGGPLVAQGIHEVCGQAFGPTLRDNNDERRDTRGIRG